MRRLNKKNKMELVKLVKDVPKDIIDGTGTCPVNFYPACPVKPVFFLFNRGETMCFLLFHRDRRTVQRISLGPAPFNSSQKTSGVYPVGPGDRTGANLTGAVYPVQSLPS